ncbi:tetratricopeptide repeat protein [Pelagerythrobacter marinus]|uniref:tetratricopeptide repeat protein n=1 Tax=Pelagerythrobacter marinus TaxID=538382 RepID=UPI00203709DD|nr:tetratricopeptide repeat protein [Pelagerythrobacter marinus]USA40908.1 tetratricopeptide repeat protein [Pelagerythrobacter marinus]WPZ07918.1 tetratricopeptide repeat protein [Pelagerythrobacter marinus]
MRFAPAAAALSLVVAITASVGQGAEREADPRAAMLVAQGRAAMDAQDPQGAIDAFEAALAVDPGHTAIFLELARAARAEGLQGKAIHYYREALARDPGNLAAISGEGEALVEKGAVEKAKANLAKLHSMCGEGCVEAQRLAGAIQRGPRAPVLTAEAVMPDAQASQAN